MLYYTVQYTFVFEMRPYACQIHCGIHHMYTSHVYIGEFPQCIIRTNTAKRTVNSVLGYVHICVEISVRSLHCRFCKRKYNREK